MPAPSRAAGEAAGSAPPGRRGARGAGEGAREGGGRARGRGKGAGLRAPLLCAGLLRAARALPSARPGAASPWPPPARSSALAPAPRLVPAAAASRAMCSARPALAALPPGPQSAPQEGEGRGAVAAARLTEPGGPLKGAVQRAPGWGGKWGRGEGPPGGRAPTRPQPSLSLRALGKLSPRRRRTRPSDGPGEFCTPGTGTPGSSRLRSPAATLQRQG